MQVEGQQTYLTLIRYFLCVY